MCNYEDILKRIKLYRKNAGLHQEQLGKKIGLSQEQYSYMETGETKISYESMMLLDDMGLSVDYLVSGKTYEYDTDDMENALGCIQNTDTKTFILKLVAELMVMWLRKSNHVAQAQDMIDILAYTVKYWDDFSMIKIVREHRGYSQFVMADHLGISVKKYRQLERENKFPDAEILMRLHEMSGFEPSLFVGDSERRLILTNKAWKLLDSRDKKKMTNFIAYMSEMLD